MKGHLVALDEPCMRYQARIEGQEQSCFICRHFAACIALLHDLGLEVEICSKEGKSAPFAGFKPVECTFGQFGSILDARAEQPKEPKRAKTAYLSQKGQKEQSAAGIGTTHIDQKGQKEPFTPIWSFAGFGIRHKNAARLIKGFLTSYRIKAWNEKSALAGKRAFA